MDQKQALQTPKNMTNHWPKQKRIPSPAGGPAEKFPLPEEGVVKGCSPFSLRREKGLQPFTTPSGGEGS